MMKDAREAVEKYFFGARDQTKVDRRDDPDKS